MHIPSNIGQEELFNKGPLSFFPFSALHNCICTIKKCNIISCGLNCTYLPKNKKLCLQETNCNHQTQLFVTMQYAIWYTKEQVSCITKTLIPCGLFKIGVYTNAYRILYILTKDTGNHCLTAKSYFVFQCANWYTKEQVSCITKTSIPKPIMHWQCNKWVRTRIPDQTNNQTNNLKITQII